MVGVIIPTYNRPDDLRMALKSLTTQTKKMFMVFVIDDCSQENIKEVCDEFKELHIVYNKLSENVGVGQARQKGIELAYNYKIDSVMFMDADDMYMPNTIERLTYELNHTKNDLIVSDIVVEHKHSPDSFIKADESLTWMHGKIYRMSFLKENGIVFPKDFRTNEDLAFNLCVYSAVKDDKKGYISQHLYLWRDNNESITRSRTELFYKCIGEDYINAIYFHYSYCKKRNIDYVKINNLFCCYNYYQLVLSRDGQVSEGIDDKIKEMFNDNDIKEKLKNRAVWYSAQEFIKTFIMEDEKPIYFKESFYNWLERMGCDPMMLENK